MPEEPTSQRPPPPPLDEPARAEPSGEDRTLDAKPYEPPKQRSRLAVASLVLGFFPIVCVAVLLCPCDCTAGPGLNLLIGLTLAFCVPAAVVVAWVTGFRSLKKEKQTQGHWTGKVYTLGGICAGLLSMLLWLSVMFLSLMYSREPQRRVACRNSLKQIGIAIQLYTDDNGGAFPEDFRLIEPPYVENPMFFRCPSARHLRTAPGKPSHPAIKTGYAYVAGLRTTDPEQCVLAFDQPANHDLWPSWHCLWAGDDAGMVNVLFRDGRVEWLAKEDIPKLLDATREAVKNRGGEIHLVGE